MNDVITQKVLFKSYNAQLHFALRNLQAILRLVIEGAKCIQETTNKEDKGLFRNHCMSGYGNLCDPLLQILDRMEFSSGHSIRIMVITTL